MYAKNITLNVRSTQNGARSVTIESRAIGALKPARGAWDKNF